LYPRFFDYGYGRGCLSSNDVVATKVIRTIRCFLSIFYLCILCVFTVKIFKLSQTLLGSRFNKINRESGQDFPQNFQRNQTNYLDLENFPDLRSGTGRCRGLRVQRERGTLWSAVSATPLLLGIFPGEGFARGIKRRSC